MRSICYARHMDGSRNGGGLPPPFDFTPGVAAPAAEKRRPGRPRKHPVVRDLGPKKPRDSHPERAPPGYYTGGQMRAQLGLTPAEFNTLLREKVIVSTRVNGYGGAIYSEDQLQAALRRKQDGSLTLVVHPITREKNARARYGASDPLMYSKEEGVAAFKALHEGKGAVDLVIELGIHPQVANRICFDYASARNMIWIPAPIVEKINGIPGLPGTFPLKSGSDVYESFVACADLRRCASCAQRHASPECSTCIEDRTASALERRIRRQIMVEQQQQVAEGAPAAPSSTPPEGGGTPRS